MKTIAACLVLLGFLAQQSHGQGAQGAAITQRARDMRDQNNAAQGAPPKNPSGSPASSSAAQPQTPKSPTPLSPAQIQQQNLNKLKNDIASFLTDTTVSQEKIGKFATNLTAVARGPKKPSTATINKLATGIGTQLTGKTIGSAEQLRLAENLEAVVNGSKLSRLQTEAYVSDIQKILQQAGAKNEDAASVAADVKATVTELKP